MSDIKVHETTYSGEFRLRPSVVRSLKINIKVTYTYNVNEKKITTTYLPSANDTRLGSVSAPRINVNNPIIPNWSCTIPGGIDTVAIKGKNNSKCAESHMQYHRKLQQIIYLPKISSLYASSMLGLLPFIPFLDKVTEFIYLYIYIYIYGTFYEIMTLVDLYIYK